MVVTENAYQSKWVQNEVARADRKKKHIFPLLLQGEPWLSVEATQYVNVSDGSLPSEKFFKRLASYTSRQKNKIASPLQSMDAAPERKKKQRFLYLRRLYELSNGNTLSYFHFTKIGKELGWKDEITDEITDYLKNEGFIDFPSFGTVSITHAGIKFVENSLKKSDNLVESLPESILRTNSQPSLNSHKFPRPHLPIKVDSQEISRFFTFVESALDDRFKTLEDAEVRFQKSIDDGKKYSYQVRYKDNLIYHFSMRRSDDDDLRISFLHGWTEPIREDTSTAFGTIRAMLDNPTPRIHITNLSLLEEAIRKVDFTYQEFVESIWLKACKVIEQMIGQLR